jgi:hypothetical protein
MRGSPWSRVPPSGALPAAVLQIILIAAGTEGDPCGRMRGRRLVRHVLVVAGQVQHAECAADYSSRHSWGPSRAWASGGWARPGVRTAVDVLVDYRAERANNGADCLSPSATPVRGRRQSQSVSTRHRACWSLHAAPAHELMPPLAESRSLDGRTSPVRAATQNAVAPPSSKVQRLVSCGVCCVVEASSANGRPAFRTPASPRLCHTLQLLSDSFGL